MPYFLDKDMYYMRKSNKEITMTSFTPDSTDPGDYIPMTFRYDKLVSVFSPPSSTSVIKGNARINSFINNQLSLSMWIKTMNTVTSSYASVIKVCIK